MLKKFILFCIFLAISFLVPSIFIDLKMTFNDVTIESGDIKDEKNVSQKMEIKDKIKLLLTDSKEIVELSMNDYLKGVLLGEVPISYEMEALKAQAIVARTYTMYKLNNNPNSHENADMCDNINCCQAYKTKEYAFASWDDADENAKWQKLEEAVNQTSNLVITYSGEIIEAFFHAHSGGQTENVKYVWGGNEIPYLQSVKSEEVDARADSKSFTKLEFKELIKDKVPNYDEKKSKVEIVDYTGSGRVYNLKIADTNIKATELRNLLGIKSTNFRIEESGDNITFYTVGYGHGVGMSQEGANQMALAGKNCEDIIKHYYSGVEILSLKD